MNSDENGNTLTDGVRTNTWDSQNRLVQCVANGTTSAFTYGSDGLRRRGVVTASDGTKTRTDYVYDASMMVEQIVQHFDANGDALDTPTTISYLQGPQGPLYRKSSAEANPSWYVYDGLGSVVGEVDVNGNLTATKSFDVYGATRSYTGNPTTRQGFVGALGHETDDETGLVYMRARYYDPDCGRFVSEDRARRGENWFAYGSNNPVNRIDASGYDDDNIASLTVGTGGAFSIEGVGSSSAINVGVTIEEGETGATLDIGTIKAAEGSNFDIRTFLQLIRAWGTGSGLAGLLLKAQTVSPEGIRLANAMFYIIKKSGDGSSYTQDDDQAQIYWAFQDE